LTQNEKRTAPCLASKEGRNIYFFSKGKGEKKSRTYKKGGIVFRKRAFGQKMKEDVLSSRGKEVDE